MRITSAALAALLVVAAAGSSSGPSGYRALSRPSRRRPPACGVDEVVWVDLDRGKFYHKAQAAFAKGNNGGYACMKAAHAQYRESHDA